MWIDGRRTLKTKKGKHKATTSTKISSESVLSFLATILKSSSDDESHQVASAMVKLSYKLRIPHLTLRWIPL